MGYSDDYIKLRNKRKKTNSASTKSTSSKTNGNPFSDYMSYRSSKISEAEKESALSWRNDEIAPVKKAQSSNNDEFSTYKQKNNEIAPVEETDWGSVYEEALRLQTSATQSRVGMSSKKGKGYTTQKAKADSEKENLNSYLKQYGFKDIKELKTAADNQNAKKEATKQANTLNKKWGKYMSASDYSTHSATGESKIKDVGWKIWEDRGDDVYDFINNINDYQDFVKAASMGNGSANAEYGEYTKYRYLTDDEKGLYNYIYAKEGKDKANEYLKDIDGYLEARHGQDFYNNMSTVQKSLYWLPSGLDKWAGDVEQFFSDEKKATSYTQHASGLVKEEAYENSYLLGNLYTAGETVSNQIPNILLTKGAGSIAGSLGASASVATKIGQAAGSVGMFTSSAGGAYGQALEMGKSKEEARTYSTIVGALEAGLQTAMGGISAYGGISESALMGKVALIENTALRMVSKYGLQIGAEIAEEELQLWLEPLARTVVFGDEYDAPELEEMVETAFITAISTGVLNSASNISEGTKVNGMTVGDAKVVDKLYKDAIAEQETDGKKLTSKEKSKIYDNIVENMDKGNIEIDTIEEVLGGKTFEEYKNITDNENALKNELLELQKMEYGKMNDLQHTRLNELKGMNLDDTTKRDALKKQLSDEVYEVAKNGRLVESYNEKARKSQAFEADLTQYTGKQRESVERAIKSGVLNNTNKSHALVDTLSKIEADKGIIFDFTDNAKLKESGFAIEGKTVNGFEKNGTVTLNVQSAKSWQSTVGHEITHTLEGTEHYGELQKALFEYAESKGELASRKATLTELYKNIDADIDKELTADLVGDYLFSDKDFINRLTGNRNLFQKIYDEIKYLCKVATGKELTEIEKVKHEFDKVWKEFNAESVKTDEKTNLSVSQVDGIDYVQAEKNIFTKEDGTLATEKEVFDSLVGKKIALSDGEVEIVKRLPNMNMYSELYKRQPKKLGGIDDVKQLNSDVNYNMEELLSTSELKKANVPDVNNRHAKQGIVDFDTRTVKFYDGEKAYTIDLTIANLQNGKKVAYAKRFYGYDAELTKKIQTAEGRGEEKSPFNQQSVSDGIVTENGNDVKTNFSVSEDSQKTDSAYLKIAESGNTEIAQKIVDDAAKNAGYDIKAYHGTGYDFTVFDKAKQGDNYQDWGRLGKGFYFAPTSREAETWAELSKGAKNKVMPVYLRSENMLDSFEALPDNLKDTIPENWDSLTRRLAEKYAYNYIEYMQEFGYNVQEILTEKGYDGINGHTEFVVFDPEQVKSADAITYDDKGNVIPLSQRFNTKNEDIRFSLSESVEETKDLIAVHNLSEEKLLKSFELGGLPMPSIAIARAKEGHSGFGNISLVFNKDTIDPNSDRNNKVYSGDAWTPVYPRIDHKINNEVQADVEERINALIPENVARDLGGLHIDSYNLEQELNRNNGNIVEVFRNNEALKYAFLVESGEKLELPTKNKRLAKYSNHPDEAIIRVAETVSQEKLRGILQEYTTEQIYEVEPEIRKAINEYFQEKYKKLPPKALEALLKKDELSRGDINDYAQEALDYLKNGVEREVDYSASKTLIKETIDTQKYEKWVKDLFANIVEKEGIRNNKDIFTPSGNRRGFEALHYEHNLENVIKAMRESGEKGLGTFGRGNIFGASTTEYKSISDIKDAANTRLQNIPQEEYDAIRKGFSDRFFELAYSLPIHKDSFTATDSAANMLIEAVSKFKTKSGIANYLRSESKGWANYNDYVVDDLIQLVEEIRQMPVDYFEAKPQRAVGFDEVATAIIPDNTSAELKQMLTDNGVAFVEYENGNEQARLNVLNSLEDAKFSLSKQGEQIAPVGNYSTPLNETALAPMQEDVAENTMVEDAPMPSDADAPPEMDYYNIPDTTAIDDKTLKNIGKSLRETLSLTPQETKAIQEIVQEYSTSETPSVENLFYAIKEKFAEKVKRTRNDSVADAKVHLRTKGISLQPQDIAGITDYKHIIKDLKGRIRIAKDADHIDVVYNDLMGVYPDLFPESATKSTADEFAQMVEVAKSSAYIYDGAMLDDATILDAVKIIYNEVSEYKSNLAQTVAEDTSREVLDSTVPTRAKQIADGSRGDALLVQSLDNFPIKTVEDRLNEKIRAVEAEIADKKQLRREKESNYIRQIEETSKEYFGLKDTSTKRATKLLNRASRLERLRASTDADYAKQISDLEARVEKMKDPKYSRAMYKQAKMQGYADWAAETLGDTTTWKDKKTGLQYATNTEHRNLRDTVRDENGNKDIARADAIYDATMGEYNRNQAAKNRKVAEVKKPFADMKITNAEAVYSHMLGEFRHNPDTTLTEKDVNEYYEKHKNKIDTEKVDKIITLSMNAFDNAYETVNNALREQGMKEIPYRKGYFPHFTEPKQNFIQKLFNWKTQDTEIPTSIAGLTEGFKPVKSWQSFDKTRHTDKTDYNILKALDTYLEGAYDWAYHLEDIQKRRAIENHIRYTHSEEGIQAKIKEVYADEELDADEAQAKIEQILGEAENPLNNFVQDFMTHTNILTNKKNSYDRTTEQAFNRKIYSTMTNVQNRMSANMVLANVRSALTNFIPITQSWAQVSPMRSLQATKDTIANAIKDDGMIDKSTFLTNRLKEVDNLYNTAWDKVLDKAGIMFEVIDNFSSQVIWRSKYNQNIAKGMTESEAIANADQFAENVMAGRSKGNEPTLFNAKSPFVKAFTLFQLEVNNQYGYFFKDVPNDLKAETNHWKLNLAKGYTTAFIGAYVYNALLEQVAGSGAALDPIGIIEDLLRDLGLFDDDEEKEPAEVVGNLAENVVQELPFVGGLFGGGRIPISSVMPYKDEGLLGGIETFTEDAGKTFDAIGKTINGDFDEADWSGLKNIGKEMMAPILNVAMPVGGGQIKKTVQGLKTFNTDEEHPVAGSYTDSGALRFPVDDTLGNRIQAGIFGQWANENAREYFDNGYAPLNEKQIQEYADVDLPIADYWKYREGLKGLDKNAEKADYINSLDIEDWQKNLLMNNILDRKEDVDMSNYDDYNSFEEFDYAQKNPEKYEFFKANGISYRDYANADEDGKKAYTWAYNNPEKYAVSKLVADDVVTYRSYTGDLYDIKADKDANGDTIVGSGKEKKIEYINNLDLDYEQKIILFKMQYKSDDTYNADIVNYLNNREDLTYDEKVTIYTELGFTVKDGYVYWD